MSNPLRTKAIAQAKIKTDKVDAYTLAQLLRSDFLPAVWQPDEQTARLRSLTGRRAALVQDRTAIKNRIHSVLHQRLMQPPSGGLFTQKGLAWPRALELDEDGRASIQSDLRLLEAVEQEIGLLEDTLVQAAAPDPRLKLLLTLPGVDVLCAETLLAALGDLSRFSDGDHAASYLGLVPSTKQSANRSFHGPITKAGSGHARWVLIQAAQHLAAHPGPLGVFFRRLAKKKNHNVAVVATARKLVVIAYLMLKSGEPYRYAQPRPTEQKLRRLELRTGGARRKTGPQKGTQGTAKLPGGSRTLKPLDQVYVREGLPPRPPLAPGEQRIIEEMEVSAFVEAIGQRQIVPRRRSAPALVAASPSPAPAAGSSSTSTRTANLPPTSSIPVSGG